MDQAAGAKQSGPHNNCEKELIWLIHNASILAETKLENIQHVVAKSCKLSISAHGPQIPSLLDSGSEVMLLRQLYFEQHLLPKLRSAMSKKADAHKLFNIMVTNDGQLPAEMYTELDITFLGAEGAKYWHVNYWRSIPGAEQETSVKAT